MSSDAPRGFPYQGKVESVDVPVDYHAGSADWRATLPNKDGALLPGMFARVHLITSKPYKAMLIPEEATRSPQPYEEPEGCFVFVVQSEGGAPRGRRKGRPPAPRDPDRAARERRARCKIRPEGGRGRCAIWPERVAPGHDRPDAAGAGQPNRSRGHQEGGRSRRRWLAVVDRGRYAESWETAARVFQECSGEGAVEQSQARPRASGSGQFEKGYQYRVPHQDAGAPDGEYVVIQYTTVFENKQSAVETVTPMLDKDKAWRVSGYYVK